MPFITEGTEKEQAFVKSLEKVIRKPIVNVETVFVTEKEFTEG